MKIPLTEAGLREAIGGEGGNIDMTMQAIKGGVLIDAQTETMAGELTFYNVTQFTNNRQETRPIWREVESIAIRQAKATNRNP